MKDRIKKIMDSEDLTAARFADMLQINRAVVSHILNGRNNPSLDVVTKILSDFNYINPDWLLSGNGLMYKDGYDPKDEKERDLFAKEALNADNDTDVTKYTKENSSQSVVEVDKTADKQQVPPIPINDRKVRQIIVYYNDNTFETFTPH
ncbi:MAG: helix-turn-helix transcriptional regulator [Bacteroidales bacterium]|jgi:transcriptional regulator with XRE-family HTH domain|nr:helix-turn-helix transcriptional regulator [Bacteroidales bacterium]